MNTVLKRNHLFLSLYQFGTTISGTEYAVRCPKCGSSTHATGFKKDIGVADSKRTCVNYIECQHCGIALCLPGEYAPPPSEYFEYFHEQGAKIVESRKERARRARQFEDTYDTRTREEKSRVAKAIERRVREWATANDIRGSKFRDLRTHALGLMYYGVNDDMDMVEPALRTVGDVRRKLDELLRLETTAELRGRLKHHEATVRAWNALTRSG